MWDDPGLVDVLRIDELLDALAGRDPAPAGGSAAALVGAMAAALCAKVARISDDGGAVAQAEALRRRLTALASEDAAAFLAALTELRKRTDDYDLGRALALAADVPLRIAEACADTAELGAVLAERGKADLQPDARAASVLAAAAARSSALLVEANLGATPGDERVARARRLADGAEAAAAAAAS
jgi:methenyltetrahydrofolate cyclohydrolase